MIVHELPLAGLFLITEEPRHDSRGYFSRFFCVDELSDAVGEKLRFEQGNVSFSRQKATIRGLHLQIPPHSETKLVRCISGRVLDFAVDLRSDSKTKGQYFPQELSAGDGQALLIPVGFAHGFLTLEDNSVLEYLVTEGYSPESERTLSWKDPTIGLRLPIQPRIWSEKDECGASFEKLELESQVHGWWRV